MALDLSLSAMLSSTQLNAAPLEKNNDFQSDASAGAGFQQALIQAQAVPEKSTLDAPEAAKPPSTSGNHSPAAASKQADFPPNSASVKDAPAQAVKAPESKHKEENASSKTKNPDGDANSTDKPSDATEASEAKVAVSDKKVGQKKSDKNADGDKPANENAEEFNAWVKKTLGIDAASDAKNGDDKQVEQKIKGDSEKKSTEELTSTSTLPTEVVAKVENTSNSTLPVDAAATVQQASITTSTPTENVAAKTELTATSTLTTDFAEKKELKDKTSTQKGAADNDSTIKTPAVNLLTPDVPQFNVAGKEDTKTPDSAKTMSLLEFKLQAQVAQLEQKTDDVTSPLKSLDVPESKKETGSQIASLASLNASLGPVVRTQASPLLSTAIKTPFGQSGWGAEVADKVMWMASQKVHAADISINPPDLGPVEAKIEMQKDQVNVVFSSQHAQVKEALEQSMPKLREMMSQNGVNLGSVDVRDHSHSQQQSQWGRSDSYTGRGEVDEAEEESNVAAKSVIKGSGMVDFYA